MQAIGNGESNIIRVKSNSPGKENEDLKGIKNRYEAEISGL